MFYNTPRLPRPLLHPLVAYDKVSEPGPAGQSRQVTKAVSAFMGVVMPLSNKDWELLPEGSYTQNSQKLYTDGPVTLKPGQTIKIPTGIRVRIDDGWWLGCFPRSGLGFKYRLQLDNTVGVIDSDYYGASNEGHIFAKLTNDSKEGKDVTVQAGDSFMQAVFIPYGITYSDDANGVRDGGMGSTGK